MTSSITFDIESGPLDTAEQLLRFEPKFVPDARLKDPEKIQDDITAKQEKWLDGAALDAGRGRVLVIGIWQQGDFEIMEGEEEAMIPWFWDLFTKSRCQWVGHNIAKFDIPFLVRRSFILGLTIPSGVFEGRYLNRRFIDTMTAWSCGVYGDYIDLDTLARALGVGKKSGKGKDFAELYKSDKAAALAYCANDLKITHDCAVKMGLIKNETVLA